MENPKPSQILMGHFEWSIKHLADSLKRPPSEYYQNAALQRLSFTFDLAKKTILAHADESGNSLSSASEWLNYAKERKWIDDLALWEKFFNKINLMNDEKKAAPTKEMYDDLALINELFGSLYKRMLESIPKSPETYG